MAPARLANDDVKDLPAGRIGWAISADGRKNRSTMKGARGLSLPDTRERTKPIPGGEVDRVRSRAAGGGGEKKKGDKIRKLRWSDGA